MGDWSTKYFSQLKSYSRGENKQLNLISFFYATMFKQEVSQYSISQVIYTRCFFVLLKSGTCRYTLNGPFTWDSQSTIAATLTNMGRHIEAETKRPPFRRRCFQIHIPDWNLFEIRVSASMS